jgi:predicted ABC-class ATPase
LTGFGVPEGITVFVGGGFHGKSTVLNAIQMGVYSKIPNDGRETVVTLPNAVKIRAEGELIIIEQMCVI